MAAPRIPNDINYWIKKGKSGKNVCLILHNDLDGIVSGLIMKDYLIKHGFNIVQYGLIDYQEGSTAFNLDNSLINICLDFASDSEQFDIYIDHHSNFSENEIISARLKGSIKTKTGSAAEGIAQQLGVPFSNDTKDWIDMVDSAKYTEYNVDIKGILEFDLKKIIKSDNAKLNFAASFNQMLKRSDHKTFIEVINASQYPSIYNIFRLFKIFYPKNNPDFKTGCEPNFVSDAKSRLAQMILKTRGIGLKEQGFDVNSKKIRYTSQQDFWLDFARNLPYSESDNKNSEILKWQVKPFVYQIIGNLMYVPSGTWANALRAKAIFAQDKENGIVPNDTKLNFVLLQYGNTLQLATLDDKMSDMSDEDLPKDKFGITIRNLGKYMETLHKNFEAHMGYKDDSTVSGGHEGIGSCSNITNKCELEAYKDVKYLDLFKNKIINDISGVQWGITMAWNEADDKYVVSDDSINKKLLNINDIRNEVFVKNEIFEMNTLKYSVKNNNCDKIDFKNETIRKIYDIWLDTKFNEISSYKIKVNELEKIYFKKNQNIENSILFKEICNKFNLTKIYNSDISDERTKQRKELKRIYRYIFNLLFN